MVQINVFHLYSLALVLHRIEGLGLEPRPKSFPGPIIGDGIDPIGKEWINVLSMAEWWVDRFLQGASIPPDTSGMIKLEQAMETGRLLQESIRGTLSDLHKSNFNVTANLFLHKATIEERLETFETALATELRDYPTFFVSKIGIYRTLDLIRRADNNISQEVLATLDGCTRADLKSAGACLAFHQFTASGFHSMRAFESEARTYHSFVTRKLKYPDNLGSLAKDLGDVLAAEEMAANTGKTTAPAATDSTLGQIVNTVRRLNKIYRNPIMHPDMMLIEKTAKEVFSRTCDVITMIREDLEDRKIKNSISSLP